MKRVFSSNQEVCHIWAQQKQSEGRASSIFFEGDTIFSYGYHYPMAKIHTVKGKKFALIYARKSSITSTQHTYAVRDALNGLMPYFDSLNLQEPKEAIKHLDGVAKETLKTALKRIKVTDKKSIRYEFALIDDAFKHANQLRKILGRASISPKKKELEAVQAHLEKRLARYHELNTPEMLAKRHQAALRKKQKEEAEYLKERDRQIELFRSGQPFETPRGLNYALLRIEGDEVVTSSRARVPLDQARSLYKALMEGKQPAGRGIGHYEVTGFAVDANNRVDTVYIGCHRILLSEAERVLGGE